MNEIDLDLDLDSPPPYHHHLVDDESGGVGVQREVENEDLNSLGISQMSPRSKDGDEDEGEQQNQDLKDNSNNNTNSINMIPVSATVLSTCSSSGIDSSSPLSTPSSNNNNSDLINYQNTSNNTTLLDQDKKNLNNNKSDSNNSPPNKIRRRTSNLNSSYLNSNNTNGGSTYDGNNNNNSTSRPQYQGKIPVMLLLLIDVLLGCGIVFILVLGIIKEKIPLLIFGGFGVLMLLAAITGLVGLFLSKSKILIFYYYWKWISIPILVCVCITLGVLVKFDYLFLHEDTVWWANVIIIGGVGFLLILWTLTCIVWLIPLIKELKSIQSVVLKEIHIDEENQVSIPKTKEPQQKSEVNNDQNNQNHNNQNNQNNQGNQNNQSNHSNHKTPELVHNYSTINNSNAVNIVTDINHNQSNNNNNSPHNNIKLNSSINYDDSDSVELLDQMTPRPQYGVLQPEDPLIVSVRKFNKNPVSGVKYIMENGLLNHIRGGIDLVTFLHTIDELSKVKVGEFLCENTPYHKEICTEFVGRYSFRGKEFDESLREFLSRFRLPGEAQKIDRMMERFAIKYHKDNPEIFPDSDTAYILAFSLIILNTDAHNPAIKNKMSKKGFVQNNTGFKGKKDLPIEYLEKLYDRIINNELKMDSDSMFTNAQMKGWLHKMTSDLKKWQKRWFVLKGNCLYYFTQEKDEEDCPPKVIIPLEGLKVTKITDLILEIEDSTVGTIKSVKLTPSGPVEGSHIKYQLKSNNMDETERWLEAIKNNTLGSPVLLLIKKKKKLLEQGMGLSSPYNNRRRSVIETTPIKQNGFIYGNNNSNNIVGNNLKEATTEICTNSESTSFNNDTQNSINQNSYIKREVDDDFSPDSF